MKQDNARFIGLLESYLSNPEKYKEYRSIKYKNNIYNVDDKLLISNEEDSETDFIAKLLNIYYITIDEIEKKVAVVLKVQWYYKKRDIPKKFDSIKQYLGENEIFLSTHKDYCVGDSINGSCQVLPYEEYDQLPIIPPNTFYTRAQYDHVKKKLIPPIEKWEKSCLCQTPLNPDQLYIQCDKCQKWFHVTCVGLENQEEATQMEHFVCSKCSITL